MARRGATLGACTLLFPSDAMGLLLASCEHRRWREVEACHPWAEAEIVSLLQHNTNVTFGARVGPGKSDRYHGKSAPRDMHMDDSYDQLLMPNPFSPAWGKMSRFRMTLPVGGSTPIEPWNSLGKIFANGLWVVGLPLTIGGSFLSVVAAILQKEAIQGLGARTNRDAIVSRGASDAAVKEGNDSGDVEPFWLNRQWLFAFGLHCVGGFLGWICLGMAPNSLAVCLGTLDVFFALLIAKYRSGEEITSMMVASCCTLVVGNGWILVFGPRSYRLRTATSLTMCFTRQLFAIISAVSASAVVAILADYYCWARERDKKDNLLTTVQLATAGSIFGCYSALFAKCTSIIFQTTILRGDFEVPIVEFYLLGAMCFMCGAFNVYYFNKALGIGDISFVLPFNRALGTLLQMVIGGVFFEEYEDFTRERHLLFWPGVGITIVGTVVLTMATTRNNAAR